MLLAIDTATTRAGIAVRGPNGPVAARTWRSDRMHTTQLVPAIDELLAALELSPPDLSAVAVAKGPGSFTSVRVGLATAKGIAGALNLPLVGVSSLLLSAWPYRGCGLELRAVVPLGRRRVAVGAYATVDGVLRELWTRNATMADAVQDEGREGRILYCGELDAGLRGLLERRPWAALPPPEALARDPAVLAELAWERLLQNDTDPAAALQAEYLDPGYEG